MEHITKSFYMTMNNKIPSKMHIPQPFVSQFDSSQFPKTVLLSRGPTRLWRVHVGKCDHGRLCFDTGWSDFVNDNVVEINDLLVFRYVKKRRFVVEIFGASGCLKSIKVNLPRSDHCDADGDSEPVPERGASKAAAERSASCRKGVEGTDVGNNVSFINEANSIKKRAFVDESSGSRKRKVSFKAPKKKVKKVMDSEKVQESKLPEAEGYICSDGPVSKRWIIKAMNRVPNSSLEEGVTGSETGTGNVGVNSDEHVAKKVEEEETTTMKTMEVVVSVEEEKPTSDEVYEAVVDILMEEDDLCSIKDTPSFVLRKLRMLFGANLSHRKAEVKSIIDTFIMNNSDDDEEVKTRASSKEG